MKIKQLMIGDWIHNNYSNEDYQVWPTFFSQATRFGHQPDATLEDINVEPIPLTDAFLKANGFKREGGASYWHEGKQNACIIHWNENKNELIIGSNQFDGMFRCYVHYIHDVQHAFTFCDIDKEFVLKAKPKKKKTTKEQHHAEESSVYDGPEGVWDNR